MPGVGEGGRHYATATKAVLHGAACIEEGFAGIALKQVAAPGGTGLGSSLITTVAIGEKFAIQLKGLVTIANPAGAYAKGAAVYITDASNALAAAPGGGISKLGRVEAIAGERGVATGMMRVNLDSKDSF